MIHSFLQWLYETGIATGIREGETAFPWIESIHVLAITIVVGSIFVVDLRLMGIASKNRPVSAVNAEVLPFTRSSFAVAAVTGLLLFSSNAVKYSANPYFLVKMLFMGMALINIGVFHLILQRGIGTWDTAAKPPSNVRLAGAISFFAWIVVVAAGRWIAYVE